MNGIRRVWREMRGPMNLWMMAETWRGHDRYELYLLQL